MVLIDLHKVNECEGFPKKRARSSGRLDKVNRRFKGNLLVKNPRNWPNIVEKA